MPALTLYIHTFCLILISLHCSAPWTLYQYFQHYIHILHFIPNSCITAKVPPLPHSSTWLPPAIHPKIFCLLSSSKSYSTYVCIKSSLHCTYSYRTYPIPFLALQPKCTYLPVTPNILCCVCWALPTTWARPAGWLFDTFSFLKLFECRFRLLAGGVRMREDFSLFRNTSEVWSCQPGWHIFQRISVFRNFEHV